MDVVRSCEYALQLERESRDYFTENAARLNHPAAAAVYRGLSDEADKHIKFLKDILKATRNGPLEKLPRITADVRGELSARSLAQIMDKEIAQELESDVAILRLGFILQRDMANYYQATAQEFEGIEQEAFEQLMNWARILVDALKSLYDQVFALYAA